MIGKVTRGTNARRLLYYLYGPGKANEHTDPHLVAGFGDPAELEPERRPGGSPDLRRLAGLLAQPMAALNGDNYAKPVWHCSVRAAPEDRLLSDAEWAQVAAHDHAPDWARPRRATTGRCGGWRSGTPRITFTWSPPWPARTGSGPKCGTTSSGSREACQEAERRFGLRPTAPADRTAARRPTRAETEQAARRGWAEPPRVDAAAGGVHRGGRGTHGGGVLRPPGPGRGAGPPAAQHRQPG